MPILNKKIKTITAFLLLLQVSVFQLEAQVNILKFNHLTVNDGLPQNSIHTIARDKYGFMWFGTWCGACRYDGYSFKVFRANDNDSTAFGDNMIEAIVNDSLQNIWIKTGEPDYLYKYSYEYENFKRFPTKNVAPYILKRIAQPKVAENDKYKFTSSESGLLQLNKITGKEKSYKVNYNDPFSINDASIYTTYIDNFENLWIGTRRGGVNHASLNIKAFNYYYADSPGKGLISNEVRAICKDKSGRLWVGTEEMGGTIIETSPQGNKYSYFNNRNFIDNRRVRSLYCDRYGFVWIGTKGGLDKYDPRTKTFKHYAADKKKPGSITNPIIFSVMEDSQGTLWVGTYSGLARYDRINDKFVYLSPSITGGVQIRVIMEDRKKNLWIATEDKGLTKLIRRSDKLGSFKSIRYVHIEGKDDSLISNRLYSLAEDNAGMIWIATNLGLSRLNPKDNTVKNFFIKDGLPDEIIMGLLFDGKESIWISHKKGLTRMNTKTFELQNFNVNDGLQSNEFNQNACFRDNTSGEMFFGGQNGLNSFFPENIKINKYKPQVVFTRLNVMNQVVQPGIKVNDRVILEKSLLCTKEIILTWWDKTFSIEFAALHYANPEGNKYKYKLEGVDNEWTFTDASMRTASYSQLPSGTYTFKVYGSNSDGIWSDAPASLRIKILPPWWLSWWALVIYTIIGGTIIVFIHKYIMSRIEISKNEEIHQSKLQFFTGISHEFRTPLTLIIDPLEKILSEKLDKETVNKYHSLMYRNAKQLLLLINQLLDFRKLESGHLTLNKQQSDIVVFVKTAAAAFESRAKDKGIHFSIKSSVSNLNTYFDAAKMNMVLNNLLSNAFKFTPKGGEVSVNIAVPDEENRMLVIKVHNTGEGISEEEQEKVFDIFYQSDNSNIQQEGSGVGLALTKELVELHGGKIVLESKLGQGATFSVFLPISEEEEESKMEFSQQEFIIGEESLLANTVQTTDSSDELPLLLIVDDNADIRNYIALNFSNEYRIILATNGSEGLLQAIETIPDIVVSDVMMPDMNGLELCRKLKSDERTSHIPVILLTARQSDESKLEGYETGADAYVTKPFNSNVLKVQIRNLLEQRQRLRELFSKGSAIEIKKIAINVTDEAFLNKVVQHIHENLEDEEFNINTLSELLNMSRSQFYRKIKALTNQSLLDFVTTIRMNKALEYLLSGEYNISETAYKVGYSMSSNFTRTFTRHFGVSPSKYLESIKK
ncbi:hybrid sensor histidine kinase/response regulator [Flavobacterium palustre]|uniref:histidine kinase n=1 Tax=Flavobacterium palustre TaxID=1476463 RepID=A0ABQ1HSC6_9FLAO|nr:two-component regulator propeller domain-containing protein [Flavobacterium palustre]GGA87625.1 hybrid sensor histidine kinase/response regulator [Flavobacterium palustre]